MTSPAGWSEPGQTPEFDEYTVVLRGMLQVETREQTLQVHAGQAVIVPRGEWVRSALRVKQARSTWPYVFLLFHHTPGASGCLI